MKITETTWSEVQVGDEVLPWNPELLGETGTFKVTKTRKHGAYVIITTDRAGDQEVKPNHPVRIKERPPAEKPAEPAGSK